MANQITLPGLEISGSNRLLICSVATEPYSGSAFVASILVDDGNNSEVHQMQQLGLYYNAPPDGLRWSTWYLTGMPEGSGRRVVANVMETASKPVVLACSSYAGVDQAQPFGNVAYGAGLGSTATLTLYSSRDGSMPWAHLFSSNVGVSPISPMRLAQATSSGSASYQVDGHGPAAKDSSFTFTWSYNGTWGAQGAMILPAIVP